MKLKVMKIIFIRFILFFISSTIMFLSYEMKWTLLFIVSLLICMYIYIALVAFPIIQGILKMHIDFHTIHNAANLHKNPIRFMLKNQRAIASFLKGVIILLGVYMTAGMLYSYFTE